MMMEIQFFERMELATANARSSLGYATLRRLNIHSSAFTQYVVMNCKAVDIPSEMTNTVLYTLSLIRSGYSLEKIAETRCVLKDTLKSNHYAILLKYNILPYLPELDIPTELYYFLAYKIADLKSPDDIFKLKLKTLVEDIEGASYPSVKVACADIYRKLKYSDQLYCQILDNNQKNVSLPVPKARVKSFASKMLSGNLELPFLSKYKDLLDWSELVHNPDIELCKSATVEFSEYYKY